MAEMGGREWVEERGRLLDRLTNELDAPPTGWTPPEALDSSTAMALAGLVSVADWIASNEEFFPYDDGATPLAEYAERSVKRAKRALRTLHWDQWRPPRGGGGMKALFECVRTSGLRPLQVEVTRVADGLEGPGLVIIEAPMGEGKTEAAMYLADRWAASLGQRGCYFALPTQATSNQMFGRVREFLSARYPTDDVNLMLLHGHASLSAEFELLRRNADALWTPMVEDEERQGGGVCAAEWFTHRKRGLLAPFGVGTVDQALLAVLQTRHVFVRLFGLANKTVIIDEVHAYDAYMSTLLERLLEWLAALGSSVVLLSATLPKERRMALAAAYARGAGEAAAQMPDGEYPLITWTSGGKAGVRHVETSDAGRKELRLTQKPNDPASLGRELQAALSGGGCAAVICNTVGRAQEVYQALKPFFPEKDAGDGAPELDLLHSRYLFGDREAREKRCLARFGKPGGAGVRRPRRAVLVATQVIEQSLDLDFDLMVSDWAPVDLLLQRAGRLHRHQRPRPKGLECAALWLCAPEAVVDGVPAFGKGNESVYDRHVLLRTWVAMGGRETMAVPDDVSGAVEAVYGPTSVPSPALESLDRALAESAAGLCKRRQELEWKAKQCRIPAPDCPDDILEDFNRQLEEDNPGVDASIQALTRVSDELTVPVVFLYGDETACCADVEGKEPVNLTRTPKGAETKVFLRRSMNLSRRGLVPRIVQDGCRPRAWRDCALLRHHRLIFVGPDGTARNAPAGYGVRMDAELGLVVDRPGKEEN
jgi:CRISPR-associated endonuclease/helicase Cas3